MTGIFDIGQWIAAIFGALCEFLNYVLSFFHSMMAGAINGVFTLVATMKPSWDVTVWQGYFNQIDYIFPLSEMIGYAVALFGLWLVVFAVRLVKSFIPTIAS